MRQQSPFGSDGSHITLHVQNFYSGQDPRMIPAYSIQEAAHYLRIPFATLRS